MWQQVFKGGGGGGLLEIAIDTDQRGVKICLLPRSCQLSGLRPQVNDR